MNMLTSMPEESGYSDDTDFLDEELIRLQFILQVAAKVLKEWPWNLKVNESKTDFVHFFKAEKDRVDGENKAVRGNEPWRKTKLLGSYTCAVSMIPLPSRMTSGYKEKE